MAQTPLIGGQYEQIRTLGRGAYGLVVLAKDVNSGEQVKLSDGVNVYGLVLAVAHTCGFPTGTVPKYILVDARSRPLSLFVQVAIKFVERREVVRNQKNIRREIVNHSLLMHPHIIQFRRWYNPWQTLLLLFQLSFTAARRVYLLCAP